MCEKCQRNYMPPSPNGRRRKLWEIRPDMHCSILGTCLDHSDLLKIGRKTGHVPAEHATEYQVHNYFVQQAEVPSRVSRLMHKTLNQKYETAIRIFQSAKNESDLKKLWSNALTKGDICGPFWALLSHACLTHSLLVQAFGEVHMLSHLNGATNRTNAKRLKNTENLLAKTKHKLALSLERHQLMIAQHAKKIGNLQQQLLLSQQSSQSHEAASERLREFENGAVYSTLQSDIAQLKIDLERTVRSRDDYSKRLDALNQELSELKIDYQNAIERIQALNRESSTPQVAGHNGNSPSEPLRNNEHESVDLYGQSIAYVGGRPATISNFRNLVENLNGNLIYHDGGVQDNIKSLNGVLNRADIVLCPVECVSHGACLKAKSYCKRAAKPFVPLRSTGLSSLMCGLKQAIEINRESQ